MATEEALSVLKKYWGYDSFRSPQEEIIKSVLEGNDTVALLPTGGGKSLCYQLPALLLPGKTIVVSPLIALMEDQVQTLNKKKIKARSLNATLTYRQIDLILDDLVYGDLKIIYISPERIQSEVFFQRFRKANISLIAVDEAHCISQWGYDFRPAYLEISVLREHRPEIPLIALTATATSAVLKDINEKLSLRQPSMFKKSFERENLSFTVIRTEDKFNQLLSILRKVTGCAVVYVRNRKETIQIAGKLTQHHFAATSYHGGMDKTTRDKNQKLWMTNQVPVIVSTNAFGMGIDKPDVRIVIHMDLAPSLEEYYQEAGRAGRDGKPSYAICIVNDIDIEYSKEQLKDQFPNKDEIAEVYDLLCRYYRIAYGDGINLSFDFNISEFAVYCEKKPKHIFHILNILDKEGWILMSEGLKEPTKIMIICSHNDLRFTDARAEEKSRIITYLLRTYEGLFTDFVKIDEWSVCKDLKMNESELSAIFQLLKSEGIIEIREKLSGPGITFLKDRPEIRSFTIDMNAYRFRQKLTADRLNAMIEYANNEKECRQSYILKYFGEKGKNCGRCDICKGSYHSDTDNAMVLSVLDHLKNTLNSGPVTLKDYIALYPHNKRKMIQSILKKLESEHVILLSDKGMINIL